MSSLFRVFAAHLLPRRTRLGYWFVGLLVSGLVGTAQAAPVTLICSTDNPADSPHVLVLQRFAELLQRYSAGQLHAQVHYRDSAEFPAIRTEEVNVNMLLQGDESLQVTVVAAGNAAQKIEPLGFLMLPYLFADTQSAEKLFASDFMTRQLNQQMIDSYGVRSLGWLIGGFRHMTNSVRPVTRLQDLAGLRIRLPASRIMVSTYESFGAEVVPMNWADVPAALQSGGIDGQENPYSVIAYSRFWDYKQKYLTENGPFLWSGPLLINEAFFQRLSAAQQALVSRAATEAVREQWQANQSQTQALQQQLLSHGMRIDALQDKPEWIKRSLPLWQEQYALIGAGDAARGQALVEQVKRVLQAP
ncbi:MAG: TRAP transporter substrate-binding protein [Pseudomonadaceae bacterium]|nr:TRAP transporter substrate-binding protein [Pseudomonadaceae bacterium]